MSSVQRFAKARLGGGRLDAEPDVVLWKVSADGAEVEKIAEGCFPTDYVPGGKFLVGSNVLGESVGVYAIPIPEKRCIPLSP